MRFAERVAGVFAALVFIGMIFAIPSSFGAESEDSLTTSILPELESASAQNMYHATAWYGGRVGLSFITPTAASSWKAAAGTEIESWNVGYYDLLARGSSKGILITLADPAVRDYTLKWKHLKRPDGGEPDYSVAVKIGETVIATQDFSAPERTQEQGGESVSLNFSVVDGGVDALEIVFMPKGAGTSGPLVGSLELELKALPPLEIVPVVETGIIEGPYKIARTTISLSGTVPDGFSRVFELKESLDVPEGNLVEVSIVSDDATKVNVSGIDFAVESPGGSITAKSNWQYDYGESTLPLSLSYINQGEAYNLSITITVKESQRELFFYTKHITGEEFAAGKNIEDSQAFDLFVRTALVSRTIFGAGELVVARVRNRCSGVGCEFPEACVDIESLDNRLVETDLDIVRKDSTSSDEDDDVLEGIVLRTEFTEDKNLEIRAEFEDGDIVFANYSVLIPRFEVAEPVSKEEFVSMELDPYEKLEKYASWARKCFIVYVYPMNVSFEGLLFYEIGCAGKATGTFKEMHAAVEIAHWPPVNKRLNSGNYWGDVAGWGENCRYDEVQDIEEVDGYIGTLIWDCPVCWQFPRGERDGRTAQACVEEGVYKNATLTADGHLPTRVQTMRIKRNSENKTLSVFVDKIFPQSQAED